MSRPPACVALVARTHGVVGATALASVILLHFLTRGLEHIEFGPRTYAISLGIGLTYLLAAVLVWFGSPGGRVLSRVCSVLYLVRPQLGLDLLRIMASEEYRAHFTTARPPPPAS
jgi:multidrug transporter EmrE-like cation transporter